MEHDGGYSRGWKPEPTSDYIVRKAQAVHFEGIGKTPELVATEAGLECAIDGKHPGMQMISFGPHIMDAHTSSERLKISSVEPSAAFLLPKNNGRPSKLSE
jgi:dipeptidase D